MKKSTKIALGIVGIATGVVVYLGIKKKSTGSAEQAPAETQPAPAAE